MVEYIIIGILVVSTTFLAYLLMLSLRRITSLETYMLEFDKIIKFSAQKMKIVDDSGHFESDDEIGFFFEQVKQLQQLLNNLFEEAPSGTTKKK
tara:strand:- start:92 stop:373 length:282 start_codon:yes stop_codon:yes gene_type:complete